MKHTMSMVCLASSFSSSWVGSERDALWRRTPLTIDGRAVGLPKRDGALGRNWDEPNRDQDYEAGFRDRDLYVFCANALRRR
jgi:hypothetical protein